MNNYWNVVLPAKTTTCTCMYIICMYVPGMLYKYSPNDSTVHATFICVLHTCSYNMDTNLEEKNLDHCQLYILNPLKCQHIQ